MASNDEVDAPLLGALLRRPFLTMRERIVEDLHRSGYEDIQSAHLAVFQFPGPHGRSPGDLSRASQISKQALNNLLRQLESAGYLSREPNPNNGRERIIRLTGRGQRVITRIRRTVVAVEREWADALGATTYEHLRAGLHELNNVLGAHG